MPLGSLLEPPLALLGGLRTSKTRKNISFFLLFANPGFWVLGALEGSLGLILPPLGPIWSQSGPQNVAQIGPKTIHKIIKKNIICWTTFGTILGSILGSLGLSWAPLGLSWALLGSLGALLGSLGALLGSLGAPLGSLGGLSWGSLGTLLDSLGALLSSLGALLGSLRALLDSPCSFPFPSLVLPFSFPSPSCSFPSLSALV